MLQLRTGARLVELLKQKQFVPLIVDLQIVIMFAASQGALAKVALDSVKEFEAELLEILNGQYFFLTRINQNELSVEDLDGIFGVCVNLINQKNADYL
jgi:F-type H+-transporting ATPase subunit alpha